MSSPKNQVVGEEGAYQRPFVPETPHAPGDPTQELDVDYGVESVQGNRPEMEDEHATLKECCRSPQGHKVSYFAVYDGHSGVHASKFLSRNLGKIIMEMVTAEGPEAHPPHEILTRAIRQVESEFQVYCRDNNCDSGSTLVAVLLYGTVLYCANVGDSEMILCRDGKPLALTEIHNMFKNPEEEKRVKDEGGVIWRKRLGHPCFNPQMLSLAVTRSIGDDFFKRGSHTEDKPSGLVAEPFVTSHEVAPVRDEFVVLACDGLWDVMDHPGVTDFVRQKLREGTNPQKISECLVETALEKGSSDNITAIVLTIRVASGAGSPPASGSGAAEGGQ